MTAPSTTLLRSQSDAALASLAGDGHAAAFEAIVVRYRRPLLRYVRHLLPAGGAEDVVQQTFLSAWSALRLGCEVRDLRPWLHSIAHNHALNARKRSGYMTEQPLPAAFSGPDTPETVHERRTAVRRVLAALSILPAKQRDILVATAVQGRSSREIGEAMNLSEGAVRQLAHRARATLRSGVTAVTPLAWLTDEADAAASGRRDPHGPAERVGELVAATGSAGMAGAAVKAGGAIVVTAAAVGVGPAIVEHRGSGWPPGPPPVEVMALPQPAALAEAAPLPVRAATTSRSRTAKRSTGRRLVAAATAAAAPREETRPDAPERQPERRREPPSTPVSGAPAPEADSRAPEADSPAPEVGAPAPEADAPAPDVDDREDDDVPALAPTIAEVDDDAPEPLGVGEAVTEPEPDDDDEPVEDVPEDEDEEGGGGRGRGRGRGRRLRRAAGGPPRQFVTKRRPSCQMGMRTLPARIGVVVKVYPRFSETFVVNEVLAHERAGAAVEIFSLRPAVEGRFHERLGRVRAPVHYLPHGHLRAEQLWDELMAATGELHGLLAELEQARGEAAGDVLQALMVARTARAAGLEHLHAHHAGAAATVTRLAARFAGLPWSMTPHADDIYANGPRTGALERTLREAAVTVTVCDYDSEHLRARFPESADRVARVYDGLDLEEFPFSPPLVRPPVIVAVGRLVEKKGFDDLLRACAVLAEHGRRFDCRIVGEGPRRDELAGLIAVLGLGDHVELLGPRSQEEVKAIVRGAAVLAAPCVIAADGNRDGLPTVLIEAMALGTPCVATGITGIPEAVHDGGTGVLVPERDPQALATALATLLEDGHARVRLARAARGLAEDEFDARRNTALLRALLAPGPPTVAVGPPEEAAAPRSPGIGQRFGRRASDS